MQSLERRLERMVDGVFSRRSRSTVKPIDLGRRLLREMDDHRSVDVKGRRIVPNEFTFLLNPKDYAEFTDFEEALRTELVEAVQEYAHDEGYYFMGAVSVRLREDDTQRAGQFSLESHLRQTPGGAGTSSLVTPTGERIPLRDQPATIGRSSECAVSVTDTNVSRRHAELRPHSSGWAVADLQSTNGTLVNGERVTSSRTLAHGDIITVGETNLRYEIS